MAPSMPWPHLHCTAPVSANDFDYAELESISYKHIMKLQKNCILWLYSNADFYHGPAPASRRKLCDVEECDIAFQIDTLKPRHNGRHFADDILKCIFLNENVCILIKISLKFLSYGPINITVALVQIMVWCRPGDKPLSEPMVVRLPTNSFIS